MSHIEPEVLAGLALGDPDVLTSEERAHLSSCERCNAELADLAGVISLGASPAAGESLLAPAPTVWQRIERELAAEVPARPTAELPARPGAELGAPPSDGEGSVTHLRRRRRSLIGRSLIAAAVGLVVGVGGTVVANNTIQQGRLEVLATTTLVALPGQTGGGTAELVRDGGAEKLRVRVDATAPAGEFLELWLINTDGRRMYSLGVLPSSGDGSYLLPPGLAASLDSYRIVDVSIEPYDGDVGHSTKSVVRGTLPT